MANFSPWGTTLPGGYASTSPRLAELAALASPPWAPMPRWEMRVRAGPSPNSTQLTAERIHRGIISGDLIFLAPAPKMSTRVWSTTHNTAQGTWSNPHTMTTAFQKQRCNAFTCIFLKHDAAHFWCIHVGCPTVRSGAKFVNKLFQANQEH